MFKLTHPSLGDLDLDDYASGVVITQKDFGWPQVREVSNLYPDDHGFVDDTAYFGQRVISIEGHIVSNGTRTRSETLALIRRYCMPNIRPVIYFDYDGGDTYHVVARGENQSVPVMSHSDYRFTMSWKCDPFFSGDAYSQQVGYAGTGFSEKNIWITPFFDLSFTAGYSASLTTTNNGVIEVWPDITVYGPITNPIITNITTGEALIFTSTTLTSTQSIKIDTKNRTLVRNDGTNVANSLDYSTSKWWKVGLGSNSVMLTGSGTTGDTYVVVEWDELHL